MIRLGIIEDNPQILGLVKEYFQDDSEIDLCMIANHVDAFYEGIKTPPDILLLDLSLPYRSGKDAIREISSKYPEMSIIVFSVSDDNASIFKCLCDGAKSYLSKGEPLEKVRETILNTYNGGSNMSVEIARKVVDFFQNRMPAQRAVENMLNERENQVVNLILEGKSYKMVADDLGISINTVRKYIKSTYRKLNINSSLELMNKFMRPPM
jgi:DNA-binding NarL/FixJ family response regulator